MGRNTTGRRLDTCIIMFFGTKITIGNGNRHGHPTYMIHPTSLQCIISGYVSFDVEAGVRLMLTFLRLILAHFSGCCYLFCGGRQGGSQMFLGYR